MWKNILKTLCLYLYFEIISAYTETSYQVFIESMFQSASPFVLKNDSPEDCKINLNGHSLELECIENFFRTESNDFDKNKTSMFICFDEMDKNNYNGLITNHCKIIKESYQGCTFRKCNSKNLQKLIIIDPEHFNKQYFNLVASSIDWYEECEDTNLFSESLEYSNKFSLDSNKCSDYNFSILTEIKELRIVINLNDLFNVEYYYIPNEDLLRSIKNLEAFELQFISEHLGVFVVKQLFKGFTKLSTLRLINCNISLLTENHFQDLISLKTLTIQGGFDNHHDWLSFQIIRNQLLYLELDKRVLGQKPNMTGFICTNSSYCDFNVDIQRKPCPIGCNCYLIRSKLQFIINCNRFEDGQEIPDLPKPRTGKTILYFNNRGLTQLPNSTLYGYSNIEELHVANNRLTSLTVDRLPHNLTYLDLRNNSLQSIDNKVLKYLFKRAGTISIKIFGNPFLCNCYLFKLLNNRSFTIEDRDQSRIKCLKENYGLWTLLLNLGFCKPLFYVISGFLLGFAVVMLMFFSFKTSFFMWLYEQNLCFSWVSRSEPRDDSVLKIDAFLAFSHKDLLLVEEFVEKLEKGSREYKLCFYHRDWLIGESIPTCILNSIEESKRIIILMTNNFINSSWGLFEFRNAIKATSMNKEKRLIVILYPGVDIDELDSELKIYMKYNTYLMRDDPMFWRKLIFAMPHKKINCAQPVPTNIQIIGGDQQ